MHDPFESMTQLTPHPTRAELRSFGIAFAILSVWLGFLAAPRLGHIAAGALWICAVLLALAAYLRPHWLSPLQLGIAWLSFPVRWLLAWCTLIVLFFAVLTPTAWIVRRLRKPSRDVSGSAWQAVGPRRGKAHYFEQS
jgi:hypothetical protein